MAEPAYKVRGTVVSPATAPISDGSNTSCFGQNGLQDAPEAVADIPGLFSAIKGGASRHGVERLLAQLAEAKPGGDKLACAAVDECGHSLTHWAAKRGDATMLEWVINRGGAIHTPSKDAVGMYPLHWASTEGRLACMRLLVEWGADFNVRDKQGCTPLIVAAQWGQADAAAYLVKIGADARIFDKNDDSSLHWASYKGNLEIVGLLHHLGLPIDNADAYGQTPLHLAALRNNLAVVEYLLIDCAGTTKARLEPKDKNGKTPCELAKEKGHGSVVKFLSAERPLCEKGVVAFVREKLTLQTCVYWMSGGTTPEAMRWPWFIMVFNKLLAQSFYFAYFLGGLFGSTGELLVVQASTQGVLVSATELARDSVPPQVHIVGLITQLVAWASFILCWRGNPGKIDGETFGALRRAYDAYFESLVSGTAVKAAPACSAGLPPLRTVTLCHSCHIQRPLRSKHCRVSRKCVMAFDHYCPYVGNTVGMYNYRWFCLYCLSFTLSAIQWQAVALCYQRRRGQGWALTAAQIWFVPFIFFGLAMVAYHAQLTFQNLTTNEHMNFARYDCFKDEESGALRNPFDKGLCNNLADKFFPPKIDQHPLLLQIARQHAPNNNQTQHAHSKKQAE